MERLVSLIFKRLFSCAKTCIFLCLDHTIKSMNNIFFPNQKSFSTNKFESGQIVVVLLLTILVGLSIGLVVTQRTITDVSISTQSEQASRAFSAAEAGLERALSGESNPSLTGANTLLNNATADVKVNPNLPNPGQALEYLKPIDKGTIAQFWLIDPDTFSGSYAAGAPLDLYFGNETAEPIRTNMPAVEVTMIYRDNTGKYLSSKTYFDSDVSNSERGPKNGITQGCEASNPLINTTNSPTGAPSRKFGCHVVVTTPASPNVPIMLRVRILYSNTPQPIALAPSGNRSLPKQATIYYSTGTSGQSQKLITYFKLKKVLPGILDFAIFSNTDITK